MNKEELLVELKNINIELSEEQINKIESFCRLLISESQKYNLTSIRKYEDILLKHVYDSLTIVKAADLKKYDNLLDIGSGAGFPGIILKIVFPNLDITLLDANRKKIKFLELVKKELDLDRLTIVNDRAETYIVNNRERFDIVTARAVANLNILLELSVPYQKIGGLFVAMKSNLEKEIEGAMETCTVLKCEIKEIIEFKLPLEKSKRSLVTVTKQIKTPNNYPRAYDKILKKPLKINQK